MRKKVSKLYTNKELGSELYNCVQHSLNLQGKRISETRLRKLRAYAQALVEPLEDHVNGGTDDDGPFEPCIKYEEVVAILVSAALFVHLSKVVGSDKLPAKYTSDILYGEEEE